MHGIEAAQVIPDRAGREVPSTHECTVSLPVRLQSKEMWAIFSNE